MYDITPDPPVRKQVLNSCVVEIRICAERTLPDWCFCDCMFQEGGESFHRVTFQGVGQWDSWAV